MAGSTPSPTGGWARFCRGKGKACSLTGQPVQDVAIYFSSRDRDWLGREEPARYFQGFQGAHRAMVLEHVPWGVVLDENVNPEQLKSFPVVMLPNVAILSDGELAMLGHMSSRWFADRHGLDRPVGPEE